MSALTIAYLAASAGLAYAGFCRIVHMSERTTHTSVRAAFFALTVAAVANVFAVLAWGYTPEWPALVMVGAQGAVMLVGRRLWEAGLPVGYRKP